MRRFTSRYSNKIDRKGRISVPAQFRSVVEEQGAHHIYLKPNLADGAIDGLTERFMDKVQEAISQLPIGSEDRDAFEDEYFSESVEIRFDPEGRIVVPKELMEFAGISDQALFIGRGERFQIWQPEAYEAYRARRQEITRGRALPSTSAQPPSGSEGGGR